MLLIACSDIQGKVFIETKNLDGETNKKIKKVAKDMQTLGLSE